ncbi:32 kDa beta-galactoside-binding lectin-like [Engraulis encrasicolus]|uniref:32 kDa beta-galactoside-binding lectin-like n=1 Tax=Engraulis encrasicolus TaxID=184585 RepID=UPI002FD1F66D
MPVNLAIDTPLEPGNKLQICGIIPQEARVIDIGLGSSWNDLSLCMIIRFHDGTVGFNTRADGKWGEEIVHSNPYKQGGKFEVTVDYTEQNFVVMMEGKTLTIPNRLNTVKTKLILVKGDLELHHFTLNPKAFPPDQGNKLHISGIITQDAYRIQVGLVGELGCDSENFSFYMDFRFHNDTVVFNTSKDGHWGEQIIHPNPYKQGDKLEVTVDCTEDNFVVMMEGKKLTIPNRLNTVKIKQIMVTGDLELHRCTVEPQLKAVYWITKTPVYRGNKLQISGAIPRGANCIQVGLGSELECDNENLSFYMDFRFHSDTVVFNTREDGYWGEEMIHPNPYKQGGKLEVTVDYTGPNYVVMMEGKLLTIPNRLNNVEIKQIMVKNDLELHCLTLEPPPTRSAISEDSSSCYLKAST